MKKVSIIIPTYNSEKTIAETIAAVKHQTYKNIQCILIDDNSLDNTLKIALEIINQNQNFKIIRNKSNKGGAKARNQGIYESEGEFIIFLDSDDIIRNDCVERRISFVDSDKDFIVFPNYKRFINEVGDLNNSIEVPKNSKNPLQDFLIHKLPLPWNISSVLWRRDALLKLNGFNENYSRIQDVEIHTRALIAELKYKVVRYDADFFYRITTNERSINEKRMHFYNASIVYIEEILDFTRIYNPNMLICVEKNLKKFLIEILTLTLISKQFSNQQTKEILEIGLKNNFFNNQTYKIIKALLVNKWINNLFKKPIIRNILFHFSNLYIGKYS